MKRALLALLVLVGVVGVAHGREQLRVAADAATLDAAGAVTTRFSRNAGAPDPTLEVTGTGVAFDLFCAGVGYEHVDLVVASRRMSAGEYAKCERNGVNRVTEIEFGRDALVLTSGFGRKPMPLSRVSLFAALAREVPQGAEGTPNKAKYWSDVDAGLPKEPIRFVGPSPKSSQMHDFVDLVMATGCAADPGAATLEASRREVVCRALRQDGAYEEGPKNVALMLERLRGERDTVAVLPFRVYAPVSDGLTAHAVDGAVPSAEQIASGRYPLVEPLVVYVKNQHMAAMPGLQRLVYEFTSERAIGPTGYLAATGMVALDDIARNRARDMALSLQPWRPASQ